MCKSPRYQPPALSQQQKHYWWDKPYTPPKKKSMCTILNVNEIKYDNPFLQKYSFDELLPSIYENLDSKSLVNFILNNCNENTLLCGTDSKTTHNDPL